jgi:hypothetical protein
VCGCYHLLFQISHTQVQHDIRYRATHRCSNCISTQSSYYMVFNVNFNCSLIPSIFSYVRWCSVHSCYLRCLTMDCVLHMGVSFEMDCNKLLSDRQVSADNLTPYSCVLCTFQLLCLHSQTIQSLSVLWVL